MTRLHLVGKPSAFDRVLLELWALLSPGPEWSTGSPELESDRTPCRVFMLFFRIITWGASALLSRAAEVARFPSTFWVASPVRVSPHLLAPCYPGVGSNWNFTKCLPLTR